MTVHTSGSFDQKGAGKKGGLSIERYDTHFHSQIRSCSSCRVSAYFLLILAWVFSVSIIADCTFLRSGLSDTQYSDLLETGIFQINLDSPAGHRCAAFPQSTFISAGVKTARAFGVIACICLGVAMVQVACLQLFVDFNKERHWLIVRVEVIVAFVSQLLTFAVFSEDECSFPNVKCVPGAAGILAILNVVILGVLIWMYWVLPSPDYPLFEIRRRAPPPPIGTPPTLEEQQRELQTSPVTEEPLVVVDSPRSEASANVPSRRNYRESDPDEDNGASPPPRLDSSIGNDDGIENPAVPLDRIDDEDSF